MGVVTKAKLSESRAVDGGSAEHKYFTEHFGWVDQAHESRNDESVDTETMGVAEVML